MIEFYKHSFEELHKYLETNEMQWVYITIVALLFIGAAITWLLKSLVESKNRKKLIAEIEKTQAEKKKIGYECERLIHENKNLKLNEDKLNSEISKLKQESLKLNAESKELNFSLLEKLQTFGDKYDNVQLDFQSALKEFSNQKKSKSKSGQKDLDSVYEDLCSFFLSRILNSFLIYFKMYKETYGSDKIRNKEFVQTDIFPFLEMTNKTISYLNNEDNLKKVNSSGLRFDFNLLSQINAFAKLNVDRSHKDKLSEAIENITKSLASNPDAADGRSRGQS